MAKKRKKKGGQAVRQTSSKTRDSTPTYKPKTALNNSKGIKLRGAPKMQNKANNKPKIGSNKPKLSKQKESAIHRLLVVLGLVADKKKANTARKNMDLTKEHPRFPFWARFINGSKRRTTLIIDEEQTINKKSKEPVDGFVHREATSKYKGGREEIEPNPDKDKRPEPMYLKRATKAQNLNLYYIIKI